MILRAITTLDKPIHSVLNATMVGRSLRSDTQMRSAEVNNVTMCSCQISLCQMSPGKITAALASHETAFTTF